MSDPYAELEAIWNRYFGSNHSGTEKDLVKLLEDHGRRLRQDDGTLRQLTISKPTSVASAFVIDLRYDKRDGTQSEDLFSVEKGGRIEPHYRGSLESKWPEYRGTHKQPVPHTLVVDVRAPITTVNTLSVFSQTSRGPNGG